MALIISSPGAIIHPNPNNIYNIYAVYFKNHGKLSEGEMDKGIPNNTASVAAREKLRTVVMEITVEARQRVKAFRRVGRGAVFVASSGDTVRPKRGRAAMMVNKIGEIIVRFSMNQALVMTKNKREPRVCVASIILKTLSTGLFRMIHFSSVTNGTISPPVF